MGNFSRWLEQAPVVGQTQMPMMGQQMPGQTPNPQQSMQQRQNSLKQLQAALGPFSQALNGLRDPALKNQITGLFQQFSQGLGKIQ